MPGLYSLVQILIRGVWFFIGRFQRLSYRFTLRRKEIGEPPQTTSGNWYCSYASDLRKCDGRDLNGWGVAAAPRLCW